MSRVMLTKRIVGFLFAIGLITSIAFAQGIFQRFFDRWSFLFEDDSGRLVASLVLDLKNASQALEEAATSPERLLLESGDELRPSDEEFLIEEVQAQLFSVREFYELALSRISDISVSEGETDIIEAYSSDVLGFSNDQELLNFISERCLLAIGIISETEGSLPDELWVQLNQVRFDLFLFYGISSATQ